MDFSNNCIYVPIHFVCIHGPTHNNAQEFLKSLLNQQELLSIDSK